MSSDPNKPVVVQATYDETKTPGIDDLASRPPLPRPHLGEDNKVRLVLGTEDKDGYDASEVHPADVDKPPFCYAGRLNLHWTSGNADVHASAQFVAPSLIITAAHCAYWSNQWNKNFYFLQSYVNGTSPFPAFKIDKIGVLAGWIAHAQSGDAADAAWAFDFAVLKIRGSAAPDHAQIRPLSDEDQSITSLGYPFNLGDGQRMFYYSGGRRVPGRFEGTVGLHPSRMGFGASGGAWFVGQGAAARVIGLNSFNMRAEGDTKTSHTPILNDATIGLITHMAALEETI